MRFSLSNGTCIAAKKAKFLLAGRCQTFEVSQSGYLAWKTCKSLGLTHQSMSDLAIQLMAEIIREADPFLSMTAP